MSLCIYLEEVAVGERIAYWIPTVDHHNSIKLSVR